MTLEEQYAAQWKKDARAEGHRKKLPVNVHPGGAVRNNPDYAIIMKSIRDGNGSATEISNDTGFEYQFVHNRLRYLIRRGRIMKVGSQWRAKE